MKQTKQLSEKSNSIFIYMLLYIAMYAAVYAAMYAAVYAAVYLVMYPNVYVAIYALADGLLKKKKLKTFQPSTRICLSVGRIKLKIEKNKRRLTMLI